MPVQARTIPSIDLDLTIKNKVISPDGFIRSAVLAGGTFPGPIISGRKGDRFRINVIDELTDNTMVQSTSIHWHGFRQQRTNWADGVSFVTQCPIAANESFLYDFTVSDQAGTYWYHSHLSTQYCDGLRGPFIVYDPDDPYRDLYDVDDVASRLQIETTIITLADWYHSLAKQSSTTGDIPTSYSTLINGKGRWTGSPSNVTLAVINVTRGKRYRFRIIAMSCEPNFTFSIDQHKMIIIEADGEYTDPLTVDQLQIFAGQRYSVVVAADQSIGNYWIRANPDPRGYPGFDGGRNSAIFRYGGAPCHDPSSSSKVENPFKESNLHALINPTAPGLPYVGGADIVILLNISVDFAHIPFPIFLVNNVSYVPPTAPTLLQILSGAQAAQDLLPHGSYYALPRNKVIEVTIPGTAYELGGPVGAYTFQSMRNLIVFQTASFPLAWGEFVADLPNDHPLMLFCQAFLLRHS
ncbi:hypothetical protein H0H93_015962 [Arthromyces matolae]|nr:hypothetical protein H0H93_015962 [Arthromyces matolae]